jgi:hypothetical protein
MKKSFWVAVVAAMIFAVNAEAQFSVGVGYANEKVISKTSSKDSDVGLGHKATAWDKSRKQLDGFYVEASYNWEFATLGSSAFALQPGVRYTLLTSIMSADEATLSTKGEGKYIESSRSSYSNHLLDMPVHVKYSYDFVPGSVKAYVFAGPVLSVGLAAMNRYVEKANGVFDGSSERDYYCDKYNVYNGKHTVMEYNNETKKYETKRERDDKYKLYDAVDLKLGLGAGVTLCEKVDVKFGYNIGLLNRSFIKRRNSEKYSVHSNILYFGVAYNF